MQEKTPIRTRKLPLRVASKEDIFSTTYLLPSVREIFTLTPGNEQAASPLHTSPVAFVRQHIPLTSTKFDHQGDATHKEPLEKDTRPQENTDAYALVLDRNAVSPPSHSPHRTNDGDFFPIERRSSTLVEDAKPLKGIYTPEKWLYWEIEE